MRRIVFASVLFLASFLSSFGQSLFISQYIETNSGIYPKGVEIFNNTGSDIILSSSNYLEIYQGTNGGTCSEITSTKVTSGTLINGEVWVIGTSDLTSYANTNGTNLSGTTTYAFAFNGDDALELYLGTTLQDVFGTCGTDPGSSWVGSGVSTANQNIQILCGIVATTSFWTDPSARFETVSTDPFNNLTGFGDAPSCSPVPEIQLQEPINTDVACGYTYDFGTQTTSTNTDVTIRIENIGTADLTILSYPITGTDASDFSVSTVPTSPISSASSTDMVIRFNASTTGSKTAKITINNDDSDEGACEINFTAVAQDPCVAPTSQPTALDLTSNTTITSIDGSFTEPSPTADNYLVVYSTSNSLSSDPVDGTTYSAGDALGGGTVVDNISGTTFTASSLTSGTEYYFFIFANNNVSCTGGPIYNTSSPISDNEITIPENPTWVTAGCTSNTTIDLSWTAATGNSTGYLLTVREGSNPPFSVNSTDPSTQTFNTDFSSASEYVVSTPPSKAVYKGTGTLVTVTGLTQGVSYIFKLYTYTIGSSDYIYSSGTQQTNVISVPDVSSESATCGNTTSSVAWANPTASCFDEILVVANETSGIDFTPSGDGSLYTANSVYSAPDDVVYKGTGTTVPITNLTNGTTYYFEIFVRKGTEWSAGVEVSCTPDVVSVLYPGDLAIIAINTFIYDGGTSSDDEVCFIAFEDITSGTAIDFTDNGYEREFVGLWGDGEGTIRIERAGSTIEKGTVICIQGKGYQSSDFTIFVCGTDDTGNWNITSLNGNGPFDLNVNDQIWIMQDGNWIDQTGASSDATYDGNVLYGWTAVGWEPSEGYDDTKGSTLFDGAHCFNTDVAATANEDKVKFYADTSITLSQAAWIGEINSTGNWTGYADSTEYFDNGLDYSSSCVKFHIDNSLGNGAGLWQGGEDNNWFNCANWLNMNVPDETIDVTILANAQNEANVDDTQEDAALFGNIAKCKNLTVEDGGDSIYVQIDDANDVLQVKETLTLEADSKVKNDNGGTLTVDGSIIIYDGALLDMHANTTVGSILNLKGNWTDNNTVDDNTHGFYETDSKVIFTGTTQQIITDATGNETFYDLKMNNATGLDLNGNDATINGELDLTLGDITTGANNVIVNNTDLNAIINDGTSSYVNGYLRRYVFSSGSYNFPVGTSSQYEIANIDMTSSSGITYFDSKFTNPIAPTDITSLGLNINGTALTTLLDYGFWTITPDALTTINYDVTLTSRGHSNGGALAGQHTIVKRENLSQDWQAYEANHSNTTQSGTGTSAITAVLSGLTTFSDFAIARSQDFVLPIVLVDFTANAKENYIELKWITESEINNDYFTIEKSLNGIDSYTLFNVDGKGNSNEKANYCVQDFDYLYKTIYYRLKQTDYNGNYVYSNIISINNSNKNVSISFYNKYLYFDLDENLNNNILITDALGRVYFNKTLTNQNQLKLNTISFEKGIYYVNLRNKTDNISKKILIF
jgi:hypothetical protein